MIKLNEEQREAIRELVKAKLALWDRATEVETLFSDAGHDVEVNASNDNLEFTCSGLDTEDQADDLDDETLLYVCELSDPDVIG